MFSRGYMEVLFKTADTPLGMEFEAALSGHSGVHLAAFSVADAEGAHARLTQAGFAMRPLVQFQRPVETASGPDIAAFTVVRLERGAMAEGPHPDSGASHREHGVAAAMAVASQRRAGIDRHGGRFR